MVKSDSRAIPGARAFLLPTLQAVASLGGSGAIPEIVAGMIEVACFTDEQQDVLHLGGPKTEIAYRTAWAQTYLKRLGLLENSNRGVWSLTEEGAQFLREPGKTDRERSEELAQMRALLRREDRARRAAQSHASKTSPDDEVLESDEGETELRGDERRSWKEQLIATLTSSDFSPAQFERLARRLLREAGFDSVKVTGQSGDQGIDGTGVYRLGLLTFPVFFQCKRYAGSVGPGAVRDFRGAMQGRGDNRCRSRPCR